MELLSIFRKAFTKLIGSFGMLQFVEGFRPVFGKVFVNIFERFFKALIEISKASSSCSLDFQIFAFRF